MAQTREINLIPYDVLLRVKTQRRTWMWTGIVLLIVVSLVGVYAVAQRKISAVEGAIADLSLKKVEIEEMMQQVSVLQDRRDRLARKERVINTLLQRRSISFLFAELAKDMNENVWLTSLHFQDNFSGEKSPAKGENSGSWVETGYFIVNSDRTGTEKRSQDEARAATTVLRGMAKSNRDLARFLERLSASEIFAEVNLRYSREGISGEPQVVEFEIETYLKDIRQT